MSQETEISVLLIEDQPDAAKLVQYVLGKSTAPKLSVDWAADLRAGLERLTERDFQAVLLDLNLPDSEGFETFARVRQESEDSAVIVLTSQEDEALALQAVRSGADEYLIKSDIRDRFLAQRIRYAIERRRLQRQTGGRPFCQGRIFGFLGAKGGAGTTTLVLNLAAALAQGGECVNAMELLPGYNAFAAHLRHSPCWDASTLLQAAPESLSRQQVDSCLLDLDLGFRVLFGPQRPEDYAPVSAAQAAALLRNCATLGDYTLVDLPPYLTSYLGEVAVHAALVTLVVERDWLGFHSAAAQLALLHSAGIAREKLALAIIDKTPGVDNLPAPDFARQLGCQVVAVVPGAGNSLAANPASAPLVSTRPDSPFAQCFADLAVRLSGNPVRMVGFSAP